MKVDFITNDFLLESPLARTLYHEYVQGLPIADYHNHLVPAELASDRRGHRATLGGFRSL